MAQGSIGVSPTFRKVRFMFHYVSQAPISSLCKESRYGRIAPMKFATIGDRTINLDQILYIQTFESAAPRIDVYFAGRQQPLKFSPEEGKRLVNALDAQELGAKESNPSAYKPDPRR
jgi:hypothetical protein